MQGGQAQGCVSLWLCVCVFVCAGDVWHIALPGCDGSLLYGYRLSGANQSKNNAPSAAGHKFDDVSHTHAHPALAHTAYYVLHSAVITHLAHFVQAGASV